MENVTREHILQCIQEENLSEILQVLSENSLGECTDTVTAVKQILKAIQPDQQKLRLQVFRFILSVLQKADVSPGVASQLLGILHTLMPHIAVSELAKVVHGLLKAVKTGRHSEGRWLEAVPQLLSRAASCSWVEGPNGETLSGPQWKQLVVQELCSCPWTPPWALPLARLFSELQVDTREVAYAVEKLLEVLPHLKLLDVAPLLHQLLLLPSEGSIITVLDATIKFLNDQPNDGSSSTKQAEGTIILHVVFATRQNLDIGRKLVHLLKERPTSFVLSKFSLALALALAKTDPLAQQLLQVLKSAVSMHFEEHSLLQRSQWARSLLQKKTAKEECMLDVADCCQGPGGWAEVVQGLVRFGFLLLDCDGQSMSDLGARLIVRVLSPVSCHTILDLLIQRLLGPSPTLTSSLAVLSKIITGSSTLVLRHETKLMELVGYLSRLPSAHAAHILRVLLPVVKVSASLRDSLVIILRKAAFSRDTEARKVAALGCLVLLPCKPLFEDIISILSKALTQQSCVRRLVYEGLPQVLSRNRDLCGPVLQLLCSQLQKYIPSNDDACPPLFIAEIVQIRMDEAVLLEPLSSLTLCCHRCLAAWLEHHPGGSELPQQLSKLLKNIVERIARVDPQDFGLDKLADWSTGSSVGQKNTLVATELRALCDALIEVALAKYNWSSNNIQDAQDLFGVASKMEQLLVHVPKKEAGVRRAPFKPPYNFSPAFLAAFLPRLFSPEMFCDSNFTQYIVAAANHWLTQSTVETWDMDFSFKIARGLLTVYEERVTVGPASLTGLCVQSVSSFLSKQQGRSEQMLPLLRALEGCSEGTLEELARKQLQRYQAFVVQVLKEDGRMKEIVSLAAMCTTLCGNIEGESARQLYAWIQSLCSQQSLEDTAACKSLLTLFFTVNSQTKSGLQVLFEVSENIHLQFGTIDEDVESNKRQTYAIINTETAASALGVLLEHLQVALQRLDWMMTLLKRYHAASNADQVAKLEVGVCRQLGYLVTIFAEISQSCLPHQLSQLTLRLLTKLFNSLAALSKYYVLLYVHKVGRLCDKFEKLVRLTGTHLTPHIYALITFLQTAEKQPKKKTQSKEVTPSLIFAIEQYEKLIIQLSKKSKVNLTEGCKRSTARDFRINAATVEAALHSADTTGECSRKRVRTDDSSDDDAGHVQ
ncbi:Fanconi anemia group I protein-like [Ornithodoros turicata]|uniref:Fanconi anemia group I protein-like n=1 Tax=Ornithodoros turicata TaxID=34597 RepID=UPI0031392CE9